MLDLFENSVDNFVDDVIHNPGGSLAATLVAAKFYGGAIVAAAPVAVPVIAGGALLYGICKLRKLKKS